jgi:hypothetical protein
LKKRKADSALWLEDGQRIERPPISECEHIQLVMAEAWVTHWKECCGREDCQPFEGDVDAYIEHLVINGARRIHDFLNMGVPIWRPKMSHPRSGALHEAVGYLVRLRIQARGGGCELCHVKNVSLDLHHPHYRSFGYEVLTDVMRLCRSCHKRRHKRAGWPQDAGWRDSIQWPVE